VVSGVRSYSVEAAQAGERLDKFLVRSCPELGRRGARWLIESALVRVDGAYAVKSRRVQAGEVVSVLGEWAGAPPAEPEAPLDVRLLRDDMVVVDKPAGQPTAPLATDERGSLAGALLGRYPEMAGVGYRSREPGLLHRLDTRTSGLVIAARSVAAFECLRDALRAHRLDKRYLAIVLDVGVPEHGVIERALMPHPNGSGRVVLASEDHHHSQWGSGAQNCQTSFRTLRRHGRWALLELVAKRAYRHQVRVHLASLGWPIAGDLDYGGAVSKVIEHRHALHASYVAWAGDERVPGFAVESPLPDDLVAFFGEEPGAAASGDDAGAPLSGANMATSSSSIKPTD
jgi:23S rRNA pseudouridine1911/1915/1917 synthase